MVNILLAAILAFVDVPLRQLSDYRFSIPKYTNYISGKVMGPDPAPYTPLRGEDQVYLYEAWSEMDQLSKAQPNSAVVRRNGFDETFLDKSGSRVGSNWRQIYVQLATNTNTSDSAAGRLIQRDREVLLAKKLYPYIMSGGAWQTAVARSAVLANSAEATTTEEMMPLGLPMPGRTLASTNVAAFFQCLADIYGIANDFNAPNSTNVNKTTSRTLIMDASFNYETGEFQYSTRSSSGEGTQIGGGLYENTLQRTAVQQRQYQGSSRFSTPLQSTAIYSFEAEDKLEVPLFTNTFAKASQLFVLNGWVVSSVGYTDFEQCWNTPTSMVYTVAISTNAMAAAEASISLFERNGMVYASVKPDYDDSYRTFLKKTGFHPPDDGYFPPAPTAAAFMPGESVTKQNTRSTDIQIYPRRLALALQVDWHSGIGEMAQ